MCRWWATWLFQFTVFQTKLNLKLKLKGIGRLQLVQISTSDANATVFKAQESISTLRNANARKGLDATQTQARTQSLFTWERGLYYII